MDQTEPDSEAKNEQEDKTKKEATDYLMELVELEAMTLFHNELREPFAVIQVDNHLEIWPCRSRMFKLWLTKQFWDYCGKPLKAETKNSVLALIEARACFSGKEHSLANRVAGVEGSIWYDLVNKHWEAVRITSNGWEIIPAPPILFRRYSHQQAQIHPQQGGDAKRVYEFLNLKDDQQKLLLIVYLVSCFIPDFPHPILAVNGAQGSGKSMLSKIFRKLIDPSAIEVSSFPKEPKELAQLLAHHWCVFFDNVSFLSQWTSDLLCKAVTGDGFAKRELYSDDDDIIYTFRRCIGLNGINQMVSKPDLLERSILLELERPTQAQRKQEKDLLEDFEKAKPFILGGILDTVSKAMQIVPTIKVEKLPRMADFTIWGCAIAEALGHTQEQFLEAYNANIDSQNEQALGGSLVADVVQMFMEEHEIWEGSASELLKELTMLAELQSINVKQEPSWPKAAHRLSKQLNEMKTNLAAVGIQLYRVKGRERVLTLKRITDNTVSSVERLSESGKIILE